MCIRDSYAYCPADVAWASFVELEGNDYVYPDRMRVMNDEIISGRDELGVLLMGHPYRSWWTGMQMCIRDRGSPLFHQRIQRLEERAV